MKNDIEQRHFVLRGLGEHLGYPKCCIDWFVDKRVGDGEGEPGELTDEQEATHEGHGFIPCPDCAQRLVEKGETSDTLIDDEKRKHPTPFPIDISPILIMEAGLLEHQYNKKCEKET